ncbi:Methyltransferase [Fimbriiglobus ruber]|uniref:Methyltransferase n=2 Tax=Fimbriiglobus ruber TaxID=1908690 RepID=A0A225D633_9BACT|nr:Methyltransferase [Fimbriiglobus ruber]
MFAGLKQTAVWRLVRGAKRAVLAPRHDTSLVVDDCRATLTAVDPPIALEAGRSHHWRIRFENLGGTAWASAGSHPVQVVARWLTYTGQPFGNEHAVPLPSPVFPGEPKTFDIAIPTPAFVGDFTLVLDLAQSLGGPHFSTCVPQSQPLRVAVPVQGRRATDIDYHEVYRNANLAQNHWWVVGAYQTKEQYEKSSRERLGMLVANGLTPDSRVLDIGCGTGQMADALQNYLSDRGTYYGTDIGEEAIAFCHETFRRRDFVFRRGEMTRVPFGPEDGAFDLAIFFSVFTHTFIDESALLLAEAKRLLAPTGQILADVIVSPLVERGAGNRGEMIVNREHFLRTADMLGLSAVVVGVWPWNPQAERLMFRFRRKE